MGMYFSGRISGSHPEDSSSILDISTIFSRGPDQSLYGELAQWVERVGGTDEVAGS